MLGPGTTTDNWQGFNSEDYRKAHLSFLLQIVIRNSPNEIHRYVLCSQDGGTCSRCLVASEFLCHSYPFCFIRLSILTTVQEPPSSTLSTTINAPCHLYHMRIENGRNQYFTEYTLRSVYVRRLDTLSPLFIL